MIWIIAIVVLLVLIAVFWYVSSRYVKKLIRAAKISERAGDYESAIYHYGEALYNYYEPAENCRAKIRYLWTAYGPFKFEKLRSQFSQRSDFDRDGDLEMFEDVIRIIGQVVAGEAEKRSFESND